jgi:hypothetical protein
MGTSRRTHWAEAADADERAGEREQGPQDIAPSLEADAQTAEVQQPRQAPAPFHQPVVPAEPLARLYATAGDPGRDASGAQGAALLGIVLARVRVQLLRSEAGPARLARRRAGSRRQCTPRAWSRGHLLPRAGPRAESPGDPRAGGTCSRVCRDPPGSARSPLPLLARTLTVSMLARVQSMARSSPSQFRIWRCSASHTPAASQSRSLRQQVGPLPQPSALGSKRQGVPVRRTKMIPPKAARSGMRGRPPLDFGRSLGRRGSMASQRSSGTRD